MKPEDRLVEPKWRRVKTRGAEMETYTAKRDAHEVKRKICRDNYRTLERGERLVGPRRRPSKPRQILFLWRSVCVGWHRV